MSWKTGSEEAKRNGLLGAQARWRDVDEAERASVAAGLNAARRAKYIEKAGAQLERLGLAVESEDQLEAAATALQRSDLRARLQLGREVRATMRSQEDAWVSRVNRLVTIFVDRMQTEVAADEELRKVIAKVSYSAMADETDRPQAERSYDRITKRLEDYRLYLHELRCPEIRWADIPCLLCGISGRVAS
jgi:hypothetical protein